MKLSYIISETFDPYYNLGLEKHLFDTVETDEVILYLWQNEKTVVCGRNQNVFKECNMSNLNDRGGHLCRRLSGGGAVYHDLGNLNFTFLARKQSYDIDRQLQVIIAACESFGVDAQKTGRNDITIDGKKFSGNAFYKEGDRAYHHGTIMVNVDRSVLSEYLNIDREKLKGKGVDSVKSRVTNLCDCSPAITIGSMREALLCAFETTYGAPATNLILTDTQIAQVLKHKNFFMSDEFLYGKKLHFTNQIGKRFSWGGIEINLSIKGDTITEAAVYSDSLIPGFILAIQELLPNTKYNSNSIGAVIDEAARSCPDDCETPRKDIQDLIKQSI